MSKIKDIELDRCYSLPRAPKYSEKIGTLNGHTIFEDSSCGYIDIFVTNEERKTIAHITLDKLKNNTICIDYTRIDRKYTGFDLAPKIYSKLIKHYKDHTFVAGSSQTKGGKSIWNRLAKRKDILVACVNKKGDLYECSYSEHGVVECEVNPYKHSGYKMIAMRRK